MKRTLSTTKTVEVCFSDVDSLQIVWHGRYVKYFEDGRECFNKQYGIGYLDILDEGYVVPIVSVNVKYNKVLRYGDIIDVETTFEDSDAAKINFSYQVFNQDRELVCSGKTCQVFTDKNMNLVMVQPAFFKQWRQKIFVP
ncbi:MAG: acyl-CoA thioesterase [Saprospiraceae bacterium]